MRLGGFFRRVRDVRDQCGQWRAGDLAVCISDRWMSPCEHNPVQGDLLLVSEVDEGLQGGVRTRGLAFASKPANHFWDARGFRKIVQDDQPASADFRLPTRPIEQVPA